MLYYEIVNKRGTMSKITKTELNRMAKSKPNFAIEYPEYNTNIELAIINIKEFPDSISLFPNSIKENDDVLNAFLKKIKSVQKPSNVMKEDAFLFKKILNYNNKYGKYYYYYNIMDIKHYSDTVKDNKEIALSLIRVNDFSELSDRLQQDKEVVLSFSNKSKMYPVYDYSVFSVLSDELKEDEDIIQAFPNHFLKFGTDRTLANRDLVLSVLKKHKDYGIDISRISDDLKNDKDIIREACTGGSPISNFEFASNELKNSAELVEEIVGQDKNQAITFYLGDELKNDKKFLVSNNLINNYTYKTLPESIRMDREISKKILQEYNFFVDEIPASLIGDYLFIFSAMKDYYPNQNMDSVTFMREHAIPEKNANNLQKLLAKTIANHPDFIPNKRTMNRGLANSVVSEIYKSRLQEWQSVLENEKLQDEYITETSALRQAKDDVLFLEHHKDWRRDKNVLVAAIEKFKEKVKKYIPKEMARNKEIALKIAEHIPSFYQNLPEEFQKDITICRHAIQDSENFEFFPEEIRNNKEIAKIAIENRPYNMKYAGDDVRDDLEIATLSLKDNPMNIRYFSDRLKDNKELVLKVLDYKVEIISNISDRLKNDYDVAYKSVSNYCRSYASLPDKFKLDEELTFLATSQDFKLTEFTLLEDYKTLEGIEKKGIEVLSKYALNRNSNIQFEVAMNKEFIPTLSQMEEVLEKKEINPHYDDIITAIYQTHKNYYDRKRDLVNKTRKQLKLF